MLTVGSLFAGIGGLELGLERTGYFKTIWQVEYDPKSKKEWKDQYAVRVLNKHWPDTQKFGDITKLQGLPYVDLICGGFPCQDISNAGKRAGIEGERSGLWKEFIRIIREVRPKYALVENVAALTQRGLYAVLADLSESGYDAEWNIVSAASVGAPHLRERIFIVAYATGGRQQQCQSQSQEKDDSCQEGNDVADTAIQGLERFNERQSAPFETKIFRADIRAKCLSIGRDQWSIEPDVGRVAHGVPNRVDRLARLGNAVVPQVAQVIGEMIKEYDKNV